MPTSFQDWLITNSDNLPTSSFFIIEKKVKKSRELLKLFLKIKKLLSNIREQLCYRTYKNNEEKI